MQGTALNGTEMETSCLENAATQRASYTAAYSSLEQAIRNFGKEKLVYEQKIQDYETSIEMGKDNLQRLHMEHQDLIAENRRLCNIHEEDERNRLALDTLIDSLERKQDLIIESFQSFENCEQEMSNRNDAYEEFLYFLKFRQNELLDIIDEMKKQGELLRDEANAKCNSLMQEVNDGKTKLEKAKSHFAEEKAAICQGHEDYVQILMGQLKTSEDLVLNERNELNLQRTAQEKLQNNFDLLSVELEEVKALMLQKEDNYSKEKNALISSHNLELNLLSVELNESKALMQQKLDEYSKEKETLISNHNLDLDLASSELNEVKALMLAKLDDYEKAKDVLLTNHKLEYDLLIGQLNEVKALMLQKEVEYLKEKDAITGSHKLELELLSVKLNEVNALMLQKQEEFSTEKDTLTSRHKLEYDLLMVELNKANTLMLQKSDEYEKQKDVLINVHKLELDALTSDKESLHQKLEEKIIDNENLQKISRDLESKIESVELELAKTKNDMQENSDKFKAEKSTLGANHEHALNKLNDQIKINEDEAQRLGTIQEKLQKDLDERQLKIGSLESELTESKNLAKKNELKFAEEKENLETTHKKAMMDLNNEFTRCKTETRALFKRYQDQKLAISKLVDDTGVRPLKLPSSSTRDSNSQVGVPLSQEKQSYIDTTPRRSTPMSSGRKLLTSLSRSSSNPRGILKRATNTIPDNNKSVTFGEVSVSTIDTFASSNSSDSESVSSGDIYQPGKPTSDNNAFPTNKRAKLGDDKQEQVMDKLENALNEEPQKAASKARRFIKQRGGLPKASV